MNAYVAIFLGLIMVAVAVAFLVWPFYWVPESTVINCPTCVGAITFGSIFGYGSFGLFGIFFIRAGLMSL